MPSHVPLAPCPRHDGFGDFLRRHAEVNGLSDEVEHAVSVAFLDFFCNHGRELHHDGSGGGQAPTSCG